MSREPTRWLAWLLALLLAWFTSSVIIYFGSDLRRHLGQRMLIATERLMGLVLVTVAVQMLMTGTAHFLAR
jgi:multiple antibiotic resistance protein